MHREQSSPAGHEALDRGAQRGGGRVRPLGAPLLVAVALHRPPERVDDEGVGAVERRRELIRVGDGAHLVLGVEQPGERACDRVEVVRVREPAGEDDDGAHRW